MNGPATGDVAPVRSVFAVAAGFFTTAILSLGGDVAFRAMAPQAFDANGRPSSESVLLIMLGYAAVFGFVGGYTTARIAIRRPIAHAVVLGCIGFAFGIVTTILAWDTAPAWYHVSALLLILPATILGAKLRQYQLR